MDARIAPRPKPFPSRFQQTPNHTRSAHRMLTSVVLSGPWRMPAEKMYQQMPRCSSSAGR
jgi:hypothetical protein